MTSFLQSFVTLNFSNPSWDLFILIFFVVVSLLYGLTLGRDRIVVVLVSIYMALAVIQNAPFLKNLTATVTLGQSFAFRITIFLGIFLVLFFLLSHSGLVKILGHGSGRGSWWQVMLFSFLHVGLLLSVVLSFLPADAQSGLAPITRTIFVSDIAKFAWILAPILVMTIVKEEKKGLSS